MIAARPFRERDPVANHKSAKKRARQAVKRTERNRHTRSRVKSAVRSARTALAAGDTGETTSALKVAESILRRAASKGVIPKKRASRHVSRLAKSQNRLAST
jgi:small subunit ribosomal protein S20